MPNETSFFTIERKNDPAKYKRWMHRIASTLHWRDMIAYNGSRDWNQYLQMDRGQHWVQEEDNQGTSSDSPSRLITVNKATSTVDSFAAFYVRRKPEFLISQTRPGKEEAERAANQTAILKYHWDEQQMLAQFKRAVRFWLVLGHGIIKTGWGTDLNEDAEVDEHGRVYTHEYVRKENPWIRCIDPRMFLLERDAPDNSLSSSRFAVEMLIEPIQNILINKEYTKSVRDSLASGKLKFENAQSIMTQYDLDTKDKKNKYFQLDSSELRSEDLALKFEIWDRKFDERIVMLSGCEEPLLTQDNPFGYLDGFPYTMFKFMPDMAVHYPLGIDGLIKHQQIELDRARTKQFNHHRKYSRKYLVHKESIEPSELNKLTSPHDEYILHSDDAGVPITTLPDPVMSIDTDRILNVIEADWAEITGSDALSRSGPLPSRTTATEVSSRENFFGVKAEAKSDIILEALVRIGTQVLQHSQKNMKRDIQVKVLGESRAGRVETFKKLTDEDIKGEFGIKVHSVNATQVDPVIDRQQSIELITLVMGNIETIAGNPIVAKAFKWLAEKIDARGADVWLDDLFASIIPESTEGSAATDGRANNGQNQPRTTPEPNRTLQRGQENNVVQPDNAALGALLGGSN